MVLPFLGIYMTTALGFSLKEAGFVLSCFGAGAVVGSVVGGWLTDRLGHFKVQVSSLLLAVPVFILLPFLKGLAALSIGVFILSCITEIFRPANSVSISHYARPENITRAFSLNRMALNLGFSMGPALGGFFAAISYHLLFYGNAFSSAVAGIVFYFYFRHRESRRMKEKDKEVLQDKTKGKSPWKDSDFLVFSVLCLLFSICFFQLLNTLPLYYKEVYQLENWDIGLLLAFNGVVVFTLEMFLVSISEKFLSISRIIILGMVLCAAAFMVLITGMHVSILYLSMFLLSVSEIFIMPFTATVAIRRATKNREGAYMGLNSLSFSAAHIVSPILGTAIAAKFGFDRLWEATALLSVITAAGFWWNLNRMKH